MFVPFSAGYHLGRLYIVPSDRNTVAMAERDLVDVIESHCDHMTPPATMKVQNVQFSVYPASDAPEGTLLAPATLIKKMGIENPPELAEVLLATDSTVEDATGL